jgi:hypothetical protein
MSLLLFVVACCVGLAFLVGMAVGTWHVVHVMRRRHRLERQAEERENRKQLAADFAEISKQLGADMSFGDYVSDSREKVSIRRTSGRVV